MSDDQAEQLDQPELVSVAEALTEHAQIAQRSAFHDWYFSMPAGFLEQFTDQGKALQGWEAGWRAALHWYIALVTRPPLTDVAIAEVRASIDQLAVAAELTAGVRVRPSLRAQVAANRWADTMRWQRPYPIAGVAEPAD